MNLDALQARIDAWRSEGAWRADPAGFRSLEALARRLPGQSEVVQRLLLRKLEAAVAAFEQRLGAAGGAVSVRRPARARPAPACLPLVQLNAYLHERSGAPEDAPRQQELPSVRRFRRAWASDRVLEQVRQAAARRPAVAGPLNSHALVLQTLELLQELSPDYLRRFVAQVESLQWLERAGVAYPAVRAKAPRDARSRGRRAKR
ncbi:MAG TPA: DUF2894 domain-containing protein [Ramlibacter sp.]|nr:DUF2894 domain-containing protein [Ramlibacter sp.]